MIDRGVLRSQEALPSERDLAVDFAVSRITVRKALDALVEEGCWFRRHGAGTFVAGRVEKQFGNLSSFSEDMAARGRIVRSEWLARAEGPVTPDESLMLGLSPGAKVYRFHRLRLADDLAMAIEPAQSPVLRLPASIPFTNSLYEALEAQGRRPVRALQRLRAVLFDPQQAKLLGIEPGAAGLFIERRGFLRMAARSRQPQLVPRRCVRLRLRTERQRSGMIDPEQTRMMTEAAEAPQVVTRQWSANREIVHQSRERWRDTLRQVF